MILSDRSDRGATMARRRFAGILAAALLAAAPARAEGDLDGTWGGAEGALSAQVIVSSGRPIGFFWGDDYVDVRDARLSADGKTLTFAFARGTATLIRTGERTAVLEVRERGKTTRMTLTRD